MINYVLKKNLFTMLLLWSSTLIVTLFGFLTQLIVARHLSVNDYGVFSFYTNLVNLAVPIALFGLPAFLLKIFGNEGWGGVRWLASSLKFFLVVNLLITFMFILFMYILPHDEVTRNILFVAGLSVIGLASIELLSTIFQLEEKFKVVAFLQLCAPTLRLFFISLIIFFGTLELSNVVYTYLWISVSLMFFIVIYIYVRKRTVIELKGHGQRPKLLPSYQNIKLSLVFNNCKFFAISIAFYLLWSQSHILVIKYGKGDFDVGIYSVALLMLNAISMIPTILFGKLLIPKYHRWASFDVEKLKVFFIYGNACMIFAGLGIGVILYFSASILINTFFGSKYSEAIILLQIFAFLLPVRFLGHSVGAILMVKENIKSKVKVMGLVAILNIVLNIYSVNKFDISIIAINTIISELILVLLYFILASKFFKNEKVIEI